MNLAARILIWVFFLLFINPVLALAAFKFGLDVRPVLFYAVISTGLFGAALMMDRTLSPLNEVRWFFVAFAALVVLGAVMYRGENAGPDFGGRLLIAHRPSGIGYVVWPALNLLSCAGLYLLARHEQFRRTIISAAFAALILQALTMEADMWWLAIFGEPNGRAGGIARNANTATLLVTLLASLTLPAALGDRLNRFSIYAVMIAAAAALFSQSKMGIIAVIVLIACLAFAARRSGMRWPRPAFVVAVVAVVTGTIWLSPVLNPTPALIERSHQLALSTAILEGSLPLQTLDSLVPLADRFASRASIDESTELRGKALVFFSGILKDHPFGLGTGFTNKFVVGPHNEWLKLAVDEGVFAALLLTIMLMAASWPAFKTKSPVLISVTLLAWLGAALSHTMIVEPMVPATLATGMALSLSRRPSLTDRAAPR